MRWVKLVGVRVGVGWSLLISSSVTVLRLNARSSVCLGFFLRDSGWFSSGSKGIVQQWKELNKDSNEGRHGKDKIGAVDTHDLDDNVGGLSDDTVLPMVLTIIEIIGLEDIFSVFDINILEFIVLDELVLIVRVHIFGVLLAVLSIALLVGPWLLRNGCSEERRDGDFVVSLGGSVGVGGIESRHDLVSELPFFPGRLVEGPLALSSLVEDGHELGVGWDLDLEGGSRVLVESNGHGLDGRVVDGVAIELGVGLVLHGNSTLGIICGLEAGGEAAWDSKGLNLEVHTEVDWVQAGTGQVSLIGTVEGILEDGIGGEPLSRVSHGEDERQRSSLVGVGSSNIKIYLGGSLDSLVIRGLLIGWGLLVLVLLLLLSDLLLLELSVSDWIRLEHGLVSLEPVVVDDRERSLVDLAGGMELLEIVQLHLESWSGGRGSSETNVGSLHPVGSLGWHGSKFSVIHWDPDLVVDTGLDESSVGNNGRVDTFIPLALLTSQGGVRWNLQRPLVEPQVHGLWVGGVGGVGSQCS